MLLILTNNFFLIIMRFHFISTQSRKYNIPLLNVKIKIIVKLKHVTFMRKHLNQINVYGCSCLHQSSDLPFVLSIAVFQVSLSE